MRPYWKGYLKLALVPCPIVSLVRSSWSTNCQLRCAISWSGCVRESPPEPSLKGTVRPHARPGDHPCPVRHGLSVA